MYHSRWKGLREAGSSEQIMNSVLASLLAQFIIDNIRNSPGPCNLTRESEHGESRLSFVQT